MYIPLIKQFCNNNKLSPKYRFSVIYLSKDDHIFHICMHVYFCLQNLPLKQDFCVFFLMDYWLQTRIATIRYDIEYCFVYCQNLILAIHFDAELNSKNFTPGFCFSLAAGDKSEMPLLLSKIVVTGQAFHIKPTILIMDFSFCSYLYEDALIVSSRNHLAFQHHLDFPALCGRHFQAKALKPGLNFR